MRASVAAARVTSNCGSKALEHGLNSYSKRTQLLLNIWDLPVSGIIETVSPALAGGFLTTEAPGKP